MSLFDNDILETDLLDVGMMSDNFPQTTPQATDDPNIEDVSTPESLFNDIVEEVVFESILEYVKHVRWKKENSKPNQQVGSLNPYNISVKQKQEIYNAPSSIIDTTFPCDHCGRKVSTVKYTYHLERCMRRRKRKSNSNYTESGSEKEEEEEDDLLPHYEILPPPPPKILENPNDLEETTEDISHEWDDEDEHNDEDEDEEDDEDDVDDLDHRSLPILGRSKLDDDIVDVDDNDTGFGIIDGSPITPPQSRGGLLDHVQSSPPIELEGLSPPNGIIEDDDDDEHHHHHHHVDDDDDQYSGLTFGRDDLFADADLSADDLHPPFSI